MVKERFENLDFPSSVSVHLYENDSFYTQYIANLDFHIYHAFSSLWCKTKRHNDRRKVMKRHFLLWGIVVGIIFFLIQMNVAFSADSASTAPLLQESNPKWKITQEGTGAIYLADNQTLENPTLKLNFLALKNRCLKLVVTANGSILRLSLSETKIELKRKNKIDTIVLSLNSDNPQLYVNGEELIDQKGALVNILEAATTHIKLECVGGSFADIKIKTGKNVEEFLTNNHVNPNTLNTNEKLNITATSLPTAATQTGEKVNTPMGRARQATFKLSIHNKDNITVSSGTGFLVNNSGLAITNFHVVRGASSADASFEGDDHNYPVELWSIAPEYDLAVVKVNNIVKDYPKPTLTLMDTNEEPGADVWALGYPYYGFTVTRGVVSGIRKFVDLPPHEQILCKEYSSNSTWIQTDCTMNHGNSGGPMINTAGKVVGISTWASLDANFRDAQKQNANFAISSIHAYNLVQKVPNEPLTFAVAKLKYGSGKTDDGAFPVVFIPHDKHTKDINAQVLAMMNSMSCPRCLGTTTIAVEEQTGTRQVGSLSFPIIETRRVTCPVCSGNGYNANAFTKQAQQLVMVIAHTDPKDKDYQKELKNAAKRLWLMAQKHPNAFLAADLPRNWAETNHKTKLKGSPFLQVGRVVKVLDDMVIVSTKSYYSYYVFSAPAYVTPKLEEDQVVIVGGIYAGTLKILNQMDEFYSDPVFQNGFIISAADTRENPEE